MMIRDDLRVFIKPERLSEGIIKKTDCTRFQSYPIVGTTGNKILVQINEHLIDIYPSWVIVDLTQNQ